MGGDADGLFDRQRTAREPRRERLAVEQLHDQEWRLDALDPREPQVVQRADVRVRQPGHDPGFAIEALPAARVVRDLRRQHLDRDEAIEPRIAGTIDTPHPARADRVEDLERTKAAARPDVGLVHIGFGTLLERPVGDPFEEAFGVLVRGQQRLDFAAKALVAEALRVHVRRAIRRRPIEGRVEQRVDALPLVRPHGVSPRSSRNSHARASTQSRFAVACARPRTAAA